MTPFHLPKPLRQFFVDNLWWLALARLVVGAMMLGMLGDLAGYSKAVKIELIMIGVIIILTIPAIVPLMKHKKLGWYLFFLTMPVQAVCITASVVESSNWILIGAVAGAIAGAYVLLDIRSYYE